jgi:hypothetical protein
MLATDVFNSVNVRIDLDANVTISNLALKGDYLKDGIHEEHRRWVLWITRLVDFLYYF